MPMPDLPPVSTELRARLKEDIGRRGILVPVLLSHDGECLDGRVRLEIAAELKLPPGAVPKIVIGRLTPDERDDLRVALNLYRRQLTRAQTRELIDWELRRDNQASDNVVGNRVGVDHKTVAVARRRLEAVGEIPQLEARNGSDGKMYSLRKPIVFTTSNAQAVEAQRLLGELGDGAPCGAMNVKRLRRATSARLRAGDLGRIAAAGPDLASDFVIHHADFQQIGDQITPGSVDLAFCDPPWGDEFAALRRPLAETISRLLKPDGVAACYTGVDHLPEFLSAFDEAGLKYEWMVVGRRQAGSMMHRNHLINCWVPIVIFRKGRFRAASPLSDVIEATASEKSRHSWQQPVEEAVNLIRALSPPGALVCDLVCCSGSTAVATIEAGGQRRFVGCEIDGSQVEAARVRVAEALAARLKGPQEEVTPLEGEHKIAAPQETADS